MFHGYSWYKMAGCSWKTRIPLFTHHRHDRTLKIHKLFCLARKNINFFFFINNKGSLWRFSWKRSQSCERKTGQAESSESSFSSNVDGGLYVDTRGGTLSRSIGQTFTGKTRRKSNGNFSKVLKHRAKWNDSENFPSQFNTFRDR